MSWLGWLQEIETHELSASQAKLREREALEALDNGLQELKQVTPVHVSDLSQPQGIHPSMLRTHMMQHRFGYSE